jgi:hypothetical protein
MIETDLRAKSGVNVRELKADVSRTNNGNPIRNPAVTQTITQRKAPKTIHKPPSWHYSVPVGHALSAGAFGVFLSLTKCMFDSSCSRPVEEQQVHLSMLSGRGRKPPANTLKRCSIVLFEMVSLPLKLEGVIRGENGLAIQSDARRHERDGSRGKDDVLGSDNLHANDIDVSTAPVRLQCHHFLDDKPQRAAPNSSKMFFSVCTKKFTDTTKIANPAAQVELQNLVMELFC